MAWHSIHFYSELTGFTERTVKKRLDGLEMKKTGNAYQYESKQALAALYSANDERLDAQRENALLARARRKKTDIERELLEGSLVKVDEVIDLWAKSINNAKTKLLAMPNRITHQLLAANDHKTALAIFKDSVNEALQELASGNIETNQKGTV